MGGIGKDEGALLRGPLLIEAQKWLDKRSQDLSEEERSFINASRALRERLEERRKSDRKRSSRKQRNAQGAEASGLEAARLVWMLALVRICSCGCARLKGEAEPQKSTAEKETKRALSQNNGKRAENLSGTAEGRGGTTGPTGPPRRNKLPKSKLCWRGQLRTKPR